MAQKFFKCEVCGNMVGMIHASGAPMTCCGQPMTEMTANTSDGAVEKHVPVVAVAGDRVTVTVGEAAHPMLPEHFIEWIYLQTEKGGQRKALAPGEAPQAVFAIEDDKPLAAFAYCNLHGLWIKEL